MSFDKYYRNLDLNYFLDKFDNQDPERGKNIFFTQAMAAIHNKSEFEEITADRLFQLLGQPDSTTVKYDYEIWKYGHYQCHGPAIIYGDMPFKIMNGMIIFWKSPDEVNTE